MWCKMQNQQQVVSGRARELNAVNGWWKKTQMECLWMDKGWQNNQNSLLKLKPGGHFQALSFAVGVFSTWQVASQRNHYMREEQGGNEHTCGCASPTSVLRSQSLHSPGQGVAMGERQREERKGEEGRDCGGDLQASSTVDWGLS